MDRAPLTAPGFGTVPWPFYRLTERGRNSEDGIQGEIAPAIPHTEGVPRTKGFTEARLAERAAWGAFLLEGAQNTLTGQLTEEDRRHLAERYNQGWIATMDITPVPIPASAWLFGSALGLLGWMRRRKQ